MAKKSERLFNTIAPIYGLFYRYQQKMFRRAMKEAIKAVDWRNYDSILDVGCGTGALCSLFYKDGLQVTGIDPAENMLQIAKKQNKGSSIQFLQANALEGLPFEDKSFDLSISSYVAHGMPLQDRKKLYQEMARVSSHKVIIYDYNDERALMTSFIEWMERGDYFRFIEAAEEEMRQCISEMARCFSSVQKVDVDKRAAWYICTPN